MPAEKLQWWHLYDEVVTSGLCTGCAGCVVVLPAAVEAYVAGAPRPMFDFQGR